MMKNYVLLVQAQSTMTISEYVPVKRVVGQKQLLCGGRRAYYRLDRMNVVIIVSDPCWVGLSLKELKTGDPDIQVVTTTSNLQRTVYRF